MNRPPTFTVTTAQAPGAIAIVQLLGPGAADRLAPLTGRRPDPCCRLVQLADIDQALAVAPADHCVLLMPHGGLRVVQRLTQALLELGFLPDDQPPPAHLYPEASSPLEADLLWTLAGAASPAAIDLLLDQPRRWHRAITTGRLDPPAILDQSARLAVLLRPPTIALVGRPNVGKSTLSNLVRGRPASLTADLPGTTRDWVGGLAELNLPLGALAVHWLDTPGLHRTADPIEHQALQRARPALACADLLVALADPHSDWPDPADLPRRPDLFLLNKADLLDPDRPCRPHQPAPDLALSALQDRGLDDLGALLAEKLGLAGLDPHQPWAFSQRLKQLISDKDHDGLARYVGL